MSEKPKNFVEKSIDSLEDVIKGFFDSAKNKDKVNEIFNSLREFIGIKTKKELDELKKDVVKENEENVKEDKEGNTLVFGDSVGVGLSVASKKYGKLYEKYVKSGASSAKIHGFLKSFGGDMEGKSVVFMSGFNDLPAGKKGADRALKYMERNIDFTFKKGGKPVVCGLYKTDYFRIDNSDVDYYNSELEKLCERKGVKFVKLEDYLAGQDLPDGLHLNTKGYGLAWEKIRKFV